MVLIPYRDPGVLLLHDGIYGTIIRQEMRVVRHTNLGIAVKNIEEALPYYWIMIRSEVLQHRNCRRPEKLKTAFLKAW